MSIKEAMEKKQISVEAIADSLGLHRNTATNKIEGKTSFSIEEAFYLKKNLFPEYDMDYLFSVKSVEKFNGGSDISNKGA